MHCSLQYCTWQSLLFFSSVRDEWNCKTCFHWFIWLMTSSRDCTCQIGECRLWRNLACKQGNNQDKLLRLTIILLSRKQITIIVSISTANGQQNSAVKLVSAPFPHNFVDKHGAWNWHLLLSGKQEVKHLFFLIMYIVFWN